jgi:hypothetical protein
VKILRRRNTRHKASLDEILEKQPDRVRNAFVDARPNPEETCQYDQVA